MSSHAPSTTPDFSAIRDLFPRADRITTFTAAEVHPFSTRTLDALGQYNRFRANGPVDKLRGFPPELQAETKRRFAALINASADEIAFVQSTTAGENIILAGLELEKRGGNVVIDDLHFEASKYMYTRLADSGAIELRVVPHREWQIDMAEYEAAVDENTRLVSVALVSQINGYKANAKAIGEIAHAHGAYFYADIIQAAGNTPIDVEAMGIDFCASASFKWLMGDYGYGYLYVKKELQGEVVKSTNYGLRQVNGVHDYDFEMKQDGSRYEGTSTMPLLPGVCSLEGLKLVEEIGVDAIRAHVSPLTDRLQAELPRLGFRPITPLGNPSPIVSFLPDDRDLVKAKLDRAFGEQVLSIRDWYQTGADGTRQRVEGVRLGVSVYNNDDDVDKLLEALS